MSAGRFGGVVFPFAGRTAFADQPNLPVTGHGLYTATGTGKTHIATALGVAMIGNGKKVRFFNTVNLINTLIKEDKEDKTGQLQKQLMGADCVILDELGYIPFPKSGGALLFHLISNLYERLCMPKRGRCQDLAFSGQTKFCQLNWPSLPRSRF